MGGLSVPVSPKTMKRCKRVPPTGTCQHLVFCQNGATRAIIGRQNVHGPGNRVTNRRGEGAMPGDATTATSDATSRDTTTAGPSHGRTGGQQGWRR